ncbi:MAG: GNAT family N-acetyltransferase [Pseudomonas sp.]|nr:GNAT family N-acetyltransferase [Pseudomonas sp.]MDZ4350462.1 GNAT family N-acetyltransferase [Xanthomonadaceae bacterium]
MMAVSSHRYSELPEKRRNELRLLASNEFDQFSIVRETTWATPDWSFLGIESQDQLACFYNLVERVIEFDNQPVKVVGLNNLVTAPGYKRRGLASKLLSDTETKWFSELSASYGLLLCADSLVPFYQRLGWQRVASEVHCEQHQRDCVWAGECMVLRAREAIHPTVIDLCGLPW